MNWTNYHSHTPLCDGRSTPDEMLQSAIDKGFVSWAFTSHAPVPFDTDWTMKYENASLYLDMISEAKEKHASKIDVYTGLEMDYLPEVGWGLKDKAITDRLDIKIGSVHFAGKFDNGEFWSVDGPIEEYEAGLAKIFGGDIKKLVKAFYRVSAEMVEDGNFDFIGHFDKIYQHGRQWFDCSEKWYKDEVNAFIALVKEKNCVIEMNTKSIKKHGILYPHTSFLKLVSDKNIPMVLNSDTHDAHLTDLGFIEAAKMMNAADINSVLVRCKSGWEEAELSPKGVEVDLCC